MLTEIEKDAHFGVSSIIKCNTANIPGVCNITHLTTEERITIQVLRVQGKSLRAHSRGAWSPAFDDREGGAAQQLRQARYLAHHAKEQALSSVKNIFRYERVRDEHVRAYVIEKLKAGWSPEQIAGRIKIDCPGKKVSHEAIYQFVYRRYFQGEGRLAAVAQAPASSEAAEGRPERAAAQAA